MSRSHLLGVPPQTEMGSDARGWPKCNRQAVRKRLRRRRRGIALVVVMVTVILVALAAYGFHYQMTQAYRVSRMQAERAQAKLAAESGVEAMLALAELTPEQRQQRIARMGQNVFRTALEPRLGEADSQATPGWSFAVVTSATAAATTAPSTTAGWRFGWTNESAKLNVAMLRRQEELYPGHAKQTLQQFPGGTPAIVDAFLAAQGFPNAGRERPGLAERFAANRGGEEATPRRLTRRWMGDDWDYNYRVDALELALGNRRGASQGDSSGFAVNDVAAGNAVPPRPWRDYLTFDSGQRNENRRGEPRIFVNGSDLVRLHQRLLDRFSTEQADFVVLARQYGLVPPGQRSSSQQAIFDSLVEAERTLEFDLPPTASLDTPLDLIDALVRIPDSQEGSVWIRSPFRRADVGDSNYLTKLAEELTVDPNPVINGQIDINAAPVEVLLGIPGISRETAERIAQARQTPPPAATAPRTSIAWLLRENVVDLATLRQWYPWITVGGDCFHAQVIGFRDRFSPVYRCTVTFDGRERPAIRRGFQQWHLWGRGFAIDRLRTSESPNTAFPNSLSP